MKNRFICTDEKIYNCFTGLRKIVFLVQQAKQNWETHISLLMSTNELNVGKHDATNTSVFSSHWFGLKISTMQRNKMEESNSRQRISPGSGWCMWLWPRGKVWDKGCGCRYLGLAACAWARQGPWSHWPRSWGSNTQSQRKNTRQNLVSL